MKTDKILLLDDEPEILNALKLRLGKDFKVHATTSPEEGIAILKENGPFQVVVSDFRMPVMNGIDFLIEVNKISPETASVLLTGEGEYNTAIDALNSGKIFRYLAKPCDALEINNVLLEGIQSYNDEINKKHQLTEYSNENRVAKIVQDQMLFSKFRPNNDNVELSALSTPKSNVCGDFYEIIPHNNDCFDLIIADVMGKGLPAAILGAAAKNTMMHEIQVLKSKKVGIPSVSEIMCSLENEIHDSLVETRMFITLLYARIDLRNMQITYVSNGHPGSLILRQNSPEVIYLQSTHMPLGICKRDFFKSINFKLKASDKLIFYTDGISEALVESSDDDPIELILGCLDGSEIETKDIAQKIFNNAKSKRGEHDDMTIISMNLGKSLGEVKPMTIYLQKRLDEIYRINSFLTDYPGESDDLFVVAVIEAFTNIVKHSKDCEPSMKMTCGVNDQGRKCIQIEYTGTHFQPDRVKLPDCSAQVNGFGLFLIENICESVDYERSDDGLSVIRLNSK